MHMTGTRMQVNSLSSNSWFVLALKTHTHTQRGRLHRYWPPSPFSPRWVARLPLAGTEEDCVQWGVCLLICLPSNQGRKTAADPQSVIDEAVARSVGVRRPQSNDQRGESRCTAARNMCETGGFGSSHGEVLTPKTQGNDSFAQLNI